MFHIPRSLFDRPSAAILKMRNEMQLQKGKGLMSGGSSFKEPVRLVVNRSTPDITQDNSEWLINEDYSILQVIQDHQGIPVNLTNLMPGHTPNFDLAADAVNFFNSSRVYRSAEDCKSRFESVIRLREENAMVYDSNIKKPKKTKRIYKTKNNRPMKTSHLYQQDNNAAYTGVILKRSKTVKELAQKRKSHALLKTQKVQKSMLTETECEKLLSPAQIASKREERMQRPLNVLATLAAQAQQLQLREFHLPGDGKKTEENEKSGVSEDETAGPPFFYNELFQPMNCDSYLPPLHEFTDWDILSNIGPEGMKMNPVDEKLIDAASIIEEKVDETIRKIESLDMDDLE